MSIQQGISESDLREQIAATQRQIAELTAQLNKMKSMELRVHVRHDFKETDEFQKVNQIANQLLSELQQPDIESAIAFANMPGKHSSEVQACLASVASNIGFSSEHQGLFASYQSGLRPDYYLQLAETGILLEVERGKTMDNNMDILDLWKCHLCPSAHYLFLFVPKALQQNSGEKPRNQFSKVEQRLRHFFDTPRNYTNVRALFLFGY